MDEARRLKLRYTLPALADLDAVLTYVSERSPDGAARIRNRIRAVLDLLEVYPGLGLLTDDPEIRRINTSPYPYLIFYQVTDHEVIVHAIRHGARDPNAMPGQGPS